MLTPYKLHILLDIYCGTEIGASKQPAPIYDETMSELERAGYCRLLTQQEPRPVGIEYDCTMKLVTLIKHIMQLPEPEWRMPC